MDIATIAMVLQAVAFILAAFFGTAQVRAVTAQRSLRAGFRLMQSLQTRDMLKSLLLLDRLPEGLSQAEIGERLGDDLTDLQALLGT